MIPRYRAWIKTENCFADYIESIRFYINEIDLCWGGICESDCFDFKDVILMQSTGLKDKNGKEIFEGDIVKTTRFFGRADEVGGFYEYDKEIIGVVKQLEGAWVIDTGSEAVNLWTEIEENEVIGNVYEQPEYLKKKGN
ncbi:hypothetical protein CYK18_06095 [Streptococcus mitis]|uniref:YopX protein domain-containing protein n=1 Tax=Streptococcus mitis TaxID=28037 RepID=A0A2I1YZ66_STRMT|nr:YopX family protein [Streptococcus mitis]PLA60175.1 hypothetical protein CYK18_06095 [Streptococcus mitis]